MAALLRSDKTDRRGASATNPGLDIPPAAWRILFTFMSLPLLLSQSLSQTCWAAPKYIPARYAQVPDSQGYPWDVRSTGAVENGRNDCFDSGMKLMVNNQQFDSPSGQMTADGRNYALYRQMGQVQVSRLIEIDHARAMARYLEVFNNPGNKTLTVRVVIRTMLGGACQQVVTSSGAPLAGAALGKKDVGVAALNPSGSRPSVVFVFSDPRSKLRPFVRVQGKRDFYVAFALTIKPKRTVTLYHTVAQRKGLGAQGLAAIYKAVYRGRLVKPNIPAKLIPTIANFPLTRTDDAPGPMLQAVLDLADALDVDRQAHDTLVMAEDAKMQGTVTCKQFDVTSALGGAKIDPADVALLVGAAGRGRPMRVYLRSGEILVGTVKADQLRMKADNSLELELDPALLDMVFFRADKTKDGEPLPHTAAMVSTENGDRLAVRQSSGITMRCATPWGTMPFELSHVNHLWTVLEPTRARRVVLRNRTRLTVFLTSRELPLPSVRWGTVQLPMHQLQAFHRIDDEHAVGEEHLTSEEVDEDPELWKIPAPYCLLAGKNALSGPIELDKLRVIGKTQVHEVNTRQLLTISRDEEGESVGTQPVFQFQLLSGSQLSGRLERTRIPIRVGDRTWQVPVEHLVYAKFLTQVPPDGDADEKGSNATPDASRTTKPPARSPNAQKILDADPF